MKIPAITNLNPRPNETNRPTARRSTNDASPPAAADDAAEPTAPQGRDFASVLEEVSRPRAREREETDADAEPFEAKTRDRAEGGEEARRRDERHGDGEGGDARGGGGFDQRGAVREVAATQEAAGARAILHIADLERIVSAVRAQTLAGGVREVTIELRRSVLEGLRVSLRLDGAGRVAAEFIASSERVRAQVDARAPELAELLRSRGVQLTTLRASVGADSSGRGLPDDGRQADAVELSAARHHGPPAAEAAPDEAAAADDDAPAGGTTTYRA